MMTKQRIVSLFLMVSLVALTGCSLTGNKESVRSKEEPHYIFDALSVFDLTSDTVVDRMGEPTEVYEQPLFFDSNERIDMVTFKYRGEEYTKTFSFSIQDKSIVEMQVWDRTGNYISFPEGTPEGLLKAFHITPSKALKVEEEKVNGTVVWKIPSVSKEITGVKTWIPEMANGQDGKESKFEMVTIFYAPYDVYMA